MLFHASSYIEVISQHYNNASPVKMERLRMPMHVSKLESGLNFLGASSYGYDMTQKSESTLGGKVVCCFSAKNYY